MIIYLLSDGIVIVIGAFLMIKLQEGQGAAPIYQDYLLKNWIFKYWIKDERIFLESAFEWL